LACCKIVIVSCFFQETKKIFSLVVAYLFIQVLTIDESVIPQCCGISFFTYINTEIKKRRSYKYVLCCSLEEASGMDNPWLM